MIENSDFTLDLHKLLLSVIRNLCQTEIGQSSLLQSKALMKLLPLVSTSIPKHGQLKEQEALGGLLVQLSERSLLDNPSDRSALTVLETLLRSPSTRVVNMVRAPSWIANLINFDLMLLFFLGNIDFVYGW